MTPPGRFTILPATLVTPGSLWTMVGGLRVGVLAVVALLGLGQAAEAAPRAALRLSAHGQPLGELSPVRLRVGGARRLAPVILVARIDGGAPITIARRRASKAGRVAFTVTYEQLRLQIEARGLVGTVTATLTVVAAGRRAHVAIAVVGLPPDPLLLSLTPADAPVATVDLLTLHVAGIRGAGPPVEIRFLDCSDTEQVVSIPRTAPVADVLLPAGGAPRTSIDATCFADQQAVAIDFSAGLVLPSGFTVVATAQAWFLPPAGT